MKPEAQYYCKYFKTSAESRTLSKAIFVSNNASCVFKTSIPYASISNYRTSCLTPNARNFTNLFF